MPKNPDLSIIILNYNTADWLENALRSIERFSGKNINLEIIVVDNASKDNSVEMVKQKFPKVNLIQSSENGGFAKGNNLGIQEAQGRYVMLFNSDAEFTDQTHLEKIIRYLDSNDAVAVMSPKLILPDGAIDLASHRGEPTAWAALTYFGKLEQIFPNSLFFGQYHQTWKNFDTIHEIDACSGAAMIVRASAIQQVGMLDEQFFMYAEDLDWCRRFREAGYSVMYFPESTVLHHKYKSGLKNSSKDTAQTTNHHFFETMKQYYEKHYGNGSQLKRLLIHKGVDLLRKMKGKRG